MTIEKKLAQQIEQEYRSDFVPPFPLEDVLKLKTIDPRNWQSLHGGLDLYFAYVAGYASGAQRLDRRPLSEIAEARKYLSQSFFERHDSLASYSKAITEESTPNLFHRLETVEKLRKQLVVLMDQILSEPVAS
jgi:hypothetical protein